MKKCMLKIIICLALSGVILGLSGCTKHEEDTESEYREFLEYSLGDYTLEKTEFSKSSSPVPHVNYGYQWTLTYMDYDDEEQTFVFDNISDFEGQFNNRVYQECERQLEDILRKHFSEENLDNGNLSIISTESSEESEATDEDSLSWVDSKSGIKLSTLTARNFHDDWGIDYSFKYYERDGESDESKEIQTRIEACLKELIDYFGDDSITFIINRENTESSILAQYDPDSQGIIWRKYGDVLDEENTINGRLQTVRLLYVGNELLVDMDMIYNESTGEYHISSGKVNRILNILGIETEVIDSSEDAFSWQIGEDEFYLNRTEREIKKNGEPFYYYKATSTLNPSSNDIRLSILGEITGTNAWYDENTRAVYLEFTNNE